MKLTLKHLLTKYCDSWWIPGLLAIIFFAITALSWGAKYWPTLFFLLFGLSLLGLFAVALRNLIKNYWLGGATHFIILLMLIIGASFFIFMFLDLSSESDNFGKDIVIPQNMKLEEPLDAENSPTNPEQDEKGRQLTAAFSHPEPTGTSQKVPANLTVLNEFSGPGRERLLRHLASSAQWFLTQEKGELYAYRRFLVHSRWRDSLNGYYTASDFDEWTKQRFQFRIIIGPDGPVMNVPWSAKTTAVKVSDSSFNLKAISDREYGQGIESYLVLRGGTREFSYGGALEIFEQSSSYSRTFTSLALRQIGAELQAVFNSPVSKQQGFDPDLIPPESVKTGPPEIHLVNGIQGGIYQVYAYVNPEAKGYVYLKVFEATRNTPLSADSIRTNSLEYTGWSNDPLQQFFYNTEITVYEGDWGTYYPARFEVWFVPASGGKERKLMERIFRIEGWER